VFDEILACLDGSPAAEKILPVAHAIASRRGNLVLLRVLADYADLGKEEAYLRELARQYNAQSRIIFSGDAAGAIVRELEKNQSAIATMTTHGRTGWSEAILGSVALEVVTEVARPVILFRPPAEPRDTPASINTIAVALDGSDFSETILPHAVEAARALDARLLLLQALPLQSLISPGPGQETYAAMEAAYLHRKADEIKRSCGITTQWEVLHGEAATAICRYLSNIPGIMLAMMSHGRAGVKRKIFGSVAGHCLRGAGVPILIYCPTSL